MTACEALVKALISLYIIGTVLFLVGIWSWADSYFGKIEGEEERRKRRAARFTLVFPFWLPILFAELVICLFRIAFNAPKKVISNELCPSCREALKRGPHR